MWRRVDLPGMEFCEWKRGRDGPRLSGTVLALIDDSPYRLNYKIRCDDGGRARELVLRIENDHLRQRFTLGANPQGHWSGTAGGYGQLLALQNCLDIDLSFTPAAKALTLRRLNLAVGETAAISVAWVQLPGPEVTRRAQRYTRLGKHRYRHEGRGIPPVEFELDTDGLLRGFPRHWKQVA